MEGLTLAQLYAFCLVLAARAHEINEGIDCQPWQGSRAR